MMDTRPPCDQLILTVTPAGVFIEATNYPAGSVRVDDADIMPGVAAWLGGARVRHGVK
jgi:hypothetical protein